MTEIICPLSMFSGHPHHCDVTCTCCTAKDISTIAKSIESRAFIARQRGGKATAEKNRAKSAERASRCEEVLLRYFEANPDVEDITAKEAGELVVDALGEAVRVQTLKRYAEAFERLEFVQNGPKRWSVRRRREEDYIASKIQEYLDGQPLGEVLNATAVIDALKDNLPASVARGLTSKKVKDVLANAENAEKWIYTGRKQRKGRRIKNSFTKVER